MKILVAGTPGTGKSTLCKFISKKLNLSYIDISKYIINKKLFSEYNKEFDTYEFDTKKISKALKSELKNDFIIETHAPEILKKHKFDYVIVLQTRNEILYSRLEKRNYSKNKINENLECEIFNEIGYDCEEIFGEVSYVENNTTVEDLYKFILNLIK